MLALLIAVTAALAVGFVFGAMFGLARRPLQAVPRQEGPLRCAAIRARRWSLPAVISRAAFFETRMSSLYLTTKEA